MAFLIPENWTGQTLRWVALVALLISSLFLTGIAAQFITLPLFSPINLGFLKISDMVLLGLVDGYIFYAMLRHRVAG